MKRIVFVNFLILITLSSSAQNEKSNIYSGGMLILQPGYTFTSNNHQKITDMSFGLGGILRFYIFNYFTAGVYGGTQRTSYSSANSQSSNISLGYGGPFVGVSYKSGRLRYTASAFGGMGTVRNLHVESQSGSTLTDAYLYKHSAFVYSPVLSVDFALTQRLMLTLQSVFLFASFDDGKTLKNPTFQVGLLFNR